MKRNPKVKDVPKEPVKLLETLTADQLAEERARLVELNAQGVEVKFLAQKLDMLDRAIAKREKPHA